jgi:hypothetical protein
MSVEDRTMTVADLRAISDSLNNEALCRLARLLG